MKNIRVLGVDDSYFVPHSTGRVKIVGVVMRLSGYIDGFLFRDVEIDGMDATERLADMLASKYSRDIKVIMTQGITMGGFNVIDIDSLHLITGKAVIVISRKYPDVESIRSALKDNFGDWQMRYERITKHKVEEVKNGDGRVWIQRSGISFEDARKIIEETTVRGNIPEPVRVAHLVASALHFGESKGKP